ncbi:CUB and sushi domain-containing protein 1 isoform X1 [Tachysurus ichikawai]
MSIRGFNRRQELGIKAELTADATAMGKFEHVWLVFAGLITAASEMSPPPDATVGEVGADNGAVALDVISCIFS